MPYQHVVVPSEGERVTASNGKLNVPDNPILLFIEGDGIGYDIMTASKRIWDAAVEKAFHGNRKISWMEVYAGEKAAGIYDGNYMPEETFDALRDYLAATPCELSHQQMEDLSLLSIRKETAFTVVGDES